MKAKKCKELNMFIFILIMLLERYSFTSAVVLGFYSSSLCIIFF